MKQRFCMVCKVSIDPERIEALPETRLCAEHGREIEKYGGEFLVSSSPERTSKPGSLKHNYGGVSVSRKRNRQALERLCDKFEEEQFEGKH